MFMRCSESGNVLFYILIGVGLLAGLSYAVSRSSRGGAESVSKEHSKIVATEILEYGDILATAVSQVRLRGVNKADISFENNIIDDYENPNCEENSCKVFDIDGGGVRYIVPKEEWLDSAYSTEERYQELYFNASSKALDKGLDSKSELIVFIPYIKKSVCRGINMLLGIPLDSAETPSETIGPFKASVPFVGMYDDETLYAVSGEATPGQSDILSPYSAGCTEASGGNGVPQEETYHFYQILIAR